MKQIPERFPTNMADRLYYLMRRLNTGYFHMILSLEGQIDERRLERSARLAADAQPLLGCRFVDHWFIPYWERRHDLEEVEFFRLEKPAQMQLTLKRFTAELCDPRWDLQFKVLVLRGQTDTVCLRLNHMVGDGGAGKNLIYLLAAIYRSLGQDPAFQPEPNLGGDRSYKMIGRQLKFMDRLAILKNLRWPMRELKRSGVSWQLPVHPSGSEENDSLSLVLPPERGQTIINYARNHKASVNLVLMTAFFRAMEAVVPHPSNVSLPIIMTVDLRRYLPSEQETLLCNRSSTEVLHVRSGPDTQFTDILAQFHKQFEIHKKNYLGLNSILPILETFPAFKVVRFLPFYLLKRVFTSRANPLQGVGSAAGFSNVGAVDPERGRFGDTGIREAYFIAPLFRVPGAIGPCVTYFNKAITFNFHYLENCLPRNIVQGVLDAMDRELPR